MRQRDFERIKVGDTIVLKEGLINGKRYDGLFFNESMYDEQLKMKKFTLDKKQIKCKFDWFVNRPMIAGVIDKNGKRKYFTKHRKPVISKKEKLFKVRVLSADKDKNYWYANKIGQ